MVGEKGQNFKIYFSASFVLIQVLKPAHCLEHDGAKGLLKGSFMLV